MDTNMTLQEMMDNISISFAMENLDLSSEDKARNMDILQNKITIDEAISSILKKYSLPSDTKWKIKITN